MTVLLRSIRPSVYNIRQFCGYEKCNVHFDGLMELHLAADSMSTTVTTIDCTCFPFLGSSPFSNLHKM
jgi:hypothetical protein